MKTRNSEKS